MTAHAWACPACGRTFARAKQWHSCDVRTPATHFAGKDPRLEKLFDTILRKLEKHGPVRVDAAKTSIHLVSRHHFGGVTVRRDHLRVGFLSRSAIESPRFVKTEKLSATRFAYTVVVREPADVDAELIAWLAEAQAMQA